MNFKQKIGQLLIPKLPFSRHVFNHFRLEMNAWLVNNVLSLSLGHQAKIRSLLLRDDLLLNIGCGPFGLPEWINLDLYKLPNVTLRFDSRRKLPLAENSCMGIHVEHFLEHLDPNCELPRFLHECKRCLKSGGILRVIVPDAELYIKGYLDPEWEFINYVGCGGDIPQECFKTKMQVLNHIFLQEGEHYGGYDAETLELVLKDNGFSDVTRYSWQQGEFPYGCIDREQHRSYSLYFEAKA